MSTLREKRKKERRALRRRKTADWTVVLILCAIAVCCGGYLIYHHWSVKQRELEYEKLRQEETLSAATETVIAEPETEESTEETVIYCDPVYDFGQLHEQNEDIYAWIVVPGTQVDYPLVLYGHNMKNGSMFGSIHSFEDETFFDGHPYIYVYTENERLTYEIYEAAKFTDVYIPSEYVISSKDDRDQFLADVREKVSDNKLHVREDMEIGEDNRLITLSTCVSGERNHRYLVIGVLVETALYR